MILGLKKTEFIAMYLIFLVSSSVVAWIIINPPQFEQFATVSVLGEDMRATNYFPGNSSKIQSQTLFRWNIQAYNHMGATQLFLLNVKLANETTTGPVYKSNLPSAGVSLSNFTRAVVNNETWTQPLNWSIVSTQGNTTIHQMQVNGYTKDLSLTSSLGRNFRIVIELWSYDLESDGFIFTFIASARLSSVWNQIWFDLKG